ncbi:hypothetical protein UR09_00360 [Candidatus Nitromaritima sp. SCGC AAA799-A02]|nr:hypothetical protein UR09_00360 [Candidatus Nitromaritima sp. SCGC AAA799-A02]
MLEQARNDTKEISLSSSSRFLETLLILVAGLVMALLTRHKWGDLIIDSGDQLFLPWQLSVGKVMHKDIFYHLGPLSSHLHAILFRVFGPGISVLTTFNLVVIGGLTVLIHRLFEKFADRLTATLACLVFLLVFAFGHYMPIGIFNYVLPYCYEITHGLLLALFTLYHFTRFVEDEKPARLIWIGVGVGLVFLTKIEIFFSLTASIVFGFLVLSHSGKLRPEKFMKSAFAGLVSAGLPALAFMVYFSIYMSPGEAFRGVFFPYVYAVGSSPGSTPFYKTVMGIDSPAINAGKMILFGGIIFLPILFFLGLNHLSRKIRVINHPAVLTVIFLSILSASIIMKGFPWLSLARALPLFILGYLTWLCIHTVRRQRSNRADKETLPIFVFTVFSILLLMKVFLNTSIANFGFVLALPATLITIKLLLNDVPRWARKVSGRSSLIKVTVLGLILLTTQAHAVKAYDFYRAKDFAVSSGSDTFLYYPAINWNQGIIVKIALDVINKTLEPGEGFTALPTGSMLNYLTRRENPIRYSFYDPFMWLTLGEETLTDALKEKKPPYIVLVTRRFPDFGYPVFGRDYAEGVLSWIMQNYTSVTLLGDPPSSGTRFGFQLLKFSG